MNELEVKKTEIEVRLVKEEIQSQVLTREQVVYWLSKMREMDLNNEDSRERIIDTFVNSIYVYDDRMVINFNCREDSEMISLGLAGESSDLCMVGELIMHDPNTFVNCDVFGFVVYLDA